jgi:hypothetical protein
MESVWPSKRPMIPFADQPLLFVTPERQNELASQRQDRLARRFLHQAPDSFLEQMHRVNDRLLQSLVHPAGSPFPLDL